MRVLLVEDDAPLARTLSAVLSDAGMTVVIAADIATALSHVLSPSERPHLVVLDILLPDGSGVTLARAAAQCKPPPAMIAISGGASGADGFELHRLGVRGYLEKPLDLTSFVATIEAVLQRTPELAPQLVALVGRQSFHEILDAVRLVLMEQALALSGGNKTKAAALLDVTRPAVQAMARRLEIGSS